MAGAEVTDCTEITGLPFDVKEPGIYCLKTNLSVSLPFGGVALAIHTDDVVIDLNGHTIEASGPTNAVAVFADAQKDVTVRNGTIRGFGGAVDLGGFTSAAQGNIVEDVRAEGSSAIAIKVAGAGSVVRHNVVVRTGGSSGGSIGILGIGSGVHILDNEVAETVEAPGAQALAIDDRERAGRGRPGQRHRQRGARALGLGRDLRVADLSQCERGREPRRQPAEGAVPALERPLQGQHRGRSDHGLHGRNRRRVDELQLLVHHPFVPIRYGGANAGDRVLQRLLRPS
jgi:hypothetical protein